MINEMGQALLTKLGTRIGLGLIWFYRHGISGFFPARCRFEPTCSAYAEQAIQRFGIWRGIWMAGWRILRCHPFYRGCLYDPVPDGKGDKFPGDET